MIAYPDVSPEPEAVTPLTQCGMRVERSYSAHQISDGTFLRDLADADVHSTRALYHLIKYYLEDPILNPLTPWMRPPIQNVYCVYGVDMKTEVSFQTTSCSFEFSGMGS
jgi:hypothetical protein